MSASFRLSRKTFRWPFAAVVSTAAFFFASALWIPAKAVLAQVLLESAWQRSLAGEKEVRPWPWADAFPAAVMEVPSLGVRQVVLAGASGRNLAFGPALVTDQGQADRIISGHRDTHFRFLGDLEPGRLIRLQTVQQVREYRVLGSEIVDSRDAELVLEPGVERLTLLTCYPLDAAVAGGPLRLVVTAEAVSL